jgi:alanine-synthesizing transaminase
MFSGVASRLRGITNPLYRLRAQLEGQGERIVDLISGNVTEHGISFPQPLLEEILLAASRRSQVYRPDPFGQKAARKAIASYYDSHGVPITPDQVLLTPGTSISYWYCFKLLANEGEEILCPCPSYPLFDYIAALSGVSMVPYLLRESRSWAIDLEDLEARISTRTRAVILISPHNPTGHVASGDEIERLAAIASRHQLAILSDEVFSEFLLKNGSVPRAGCSAAPLVLTLNGISKMFALPGLKLGWMAVSGEKRNIAQALTALELISDTFLPVSELVQSAAPELFQEGREFLRHYVAEIRKRYETARDVLRGCSRIGISEPEGGFYMTLKLEDLEEERAAEEILKREKILLHPGHYYDIPPHHLVLSFVQKSESLRETLHRLLAVLESL